MSSLTSWTKRLKDWTKNKWIETRQGHFVLGYFRVCNFYLRTLLFPWVRQFADDDDWPTWCSHFSTQYLQNPSLLVHSVAVSDRKNNHLTREKTAWGPYSEQTQRCFPQKNFAGWLALKDERQNRISFAWCKWIFTVDKCVTSKSYEVAIGNKKCLPRVASWYNLAAHFRNVIIDQWIFSQLLN